MMKKLLAVLGFLVVYISAYSQDYTKSEFYKSFTRGFKLSAEDRERPINRYHSILLKTNSQGEVISWQPSNSMPESIRKEVDFAFRYADKSGLQTFKLTNRKLILPIFMIKTTAASEISDEMWHYDSHLRRKPKRGRGIIILPPVVFYYPNAAWFNN